MSKVIGIMAQCKGCDYVTPLTGMCWKLEDKYAPAGFWRRGGCPYATHVVHEAKVDQGKVRAGQQKQKKIKKV